MFALGNGYLGMRGCFEEGGPIGQNGTFINGFCIEPWPILYPGGSLTRLATTGQTIVNATDTKIVKLYVDDEPFWLAQCARAEPFERRLNMRSGTRLIATLSGETPSGKTGLDQIPPLSCLSIGIWRRFSTKSSCRTPKPGGDFI